MTLLSTLRPAEQRALGDAVRAAAWSPDDQLLAIGADGRAVLDAGGRPTAPIGPDPLDCCWITNERVAVVDGLLGVIVAGGGGVDVVPVERALTVGAAPPSPDRPPHAVVAGGDGCTVVPATGSPAGGSTTIETGPLRHLVHVGGAMWLGGGTDGLVAIDVALGCVDQRIELAGVTALAVSSGTGRVAASDSTGAIHVLELAHLDRGAELDGYPDAVRHLDIASGGDLVVAAADDELTWWSIASDGTVAEQPDCSVGHDVPITACALGATGFVATGDADGVVRLWSPRLRDLPVGRLTLEHEVTVLAWNPSGDRLAIGTAGSELVIAGIEAGELL